MDLNQAQQDWGRSLLDDEETLALLHTGHLTSPPFPGDCGIDLTTRQAAVLYEGQTADLPCGVKIALPSGTFGLVCARSSTWTRYRLWVMPGVIDEGFRGELYAMVYRPPRYRRPGDRDRDHIKIPEGTRLAQLIVLPNLLSRIKLEPADSLPPSERGNHGFGSSGA